MELAMVPFKKGGAMSSILLERGTKPNSLEVHTFQMVRQEEKVYIGRDIKMTLPDFCEMVKYVLTNTSLQQENDPRLNLLQALREMQIVKTPEGGERLTLQTPKDVN